MIIPRLAVKEDMVQVWQLIKELAIFEKERNAVEISISELEEHGFGDKPQFVCFVVEDDKKLFGMALVYPRYSTWKGQVLHLEDLIVSESYRGQGYGTLLLDTVVKYGKSLGVNRISWEVLDWNEPAIGFYEKKGAKVLRDWNVVQLNKEEINNYLDKL
jgi:GNAT superfamily N-acetyltransferase